MKPRPSGRPPSMRAATNCIRYPAGGPLPSALLTLTVHCGTRRAHAASRRRQQHASRDKKLACRCLVDVDDGGRRVWHLPHAARWLCAGCCRPGRRLASCVGTGAHKIWLFSPRAAHPHAFLATNNHGTWCISQCSHYFHLMCITTWLHNKNTCPICRRKWEFQTGPKPAPATPGRRVTGEGFSGATDGAAPGGQPEIIEAD